MRGQRLFDVQESLCQVNFAHWTIFLNHNIEQMFEKSLIIIFYCVIIQKTQTNVRYGEEGNV